jgi:hypothetical protein
LLVEQVIDARALVGSSARAQVGQTISHDAGLAGRFPLVVVSQGRP